MLLKLCTLILGSAVSEIIADLSSELQTTFFIHSKTTGINFSFHDSSRSQFFKKIGRD